MLKCCLPSTWWIFYLKCTLQPQHCLVPLALHTVFPQSIYHLMYLLFLVAIIFFFLLECKALWEKRFLSLFYIVASQQCMDLSGVKWMNDACVNACKAHVFSTRPSHFSFINGEVDKWLGYFCYGGHFQIILHHSILHFEYFSYIFFLILEYKPFFYF